MPGGGLMKYLNWSVYALFSIVTMVMLGSLPLLRAADELTPTSADSMIRLVVFGALAAAVGFMFGLPDQPFVRQRMRAALATALAVPALLAVSRVILGTAFVPGPVLAASIPALWLVDVLVATGIMATSPRSRDRVLMICSPTDFATAALDHAQHSEVPCTLVGHVALNDPAALQSVGELIRGQDVTLVVVSDEAIRIPAVTEALAGVHLQGTRIHTLTDFYMEWLGKVPLRHLEVSALLFDVRERHHVGYLRLSRVLDIVLALVGLVVLVIAIPFVLVGNAFGNRGPLFFSQRRVGRDQEIFDIHKFRTMRDGPSDGHWTSPDDPRITPFGRTLRTLHLDELPQVINVLRGDLSIVGPRPEQPHYVEQLTAQIPYYIMRHLVRPGLTGWAQVNYPYGADEDDAFQKLQFELWYLNHQSIWLDLRIVNRTARHVLGFKPRPVRAGSEVDECRSLMS